MRRKQRRNGENMNEREFVIVLSDIHIGTTAPTVLYRKEIHEKYLISIFDDIIAYANKIQEVILLGDIFELWAYPPDELPPVIDDIIAANPNILGSMGKLSQALSALRGRMTYIPGDHDLNITQEDINKIKSSEGYTIKYHAGAYIPQYDKHILFTHGNEYTLLNAPYRGCRLSPLPIGYFLSRAIAYKVQKILSKTPGLTIANLEEYGVNDITLFLSKSPDILKNYKNSADFVIKLIDAIAYTTGIPKDLQIKINETMSASLNNVKEIYKDLLNEFNIYLNKFGINDQTILKKALTTDFNKSSLPWYVKKNILGNKIDIAVMGHTHSPAITFSNDMIDYVNTGFMCPSISDLQEKPITYGIYNRSKHLVNLIKVTGDSTYCIDSNTNHITGMSVDYGDIMTPYPKSTYYDNAIDIYSMKDTLATTIQIKETNSHPSTPSKKLTFGWSVYNSSWEYYMTMQQGVLSKAKELGIDVISEDQKSNAEEMITGSISLISKGINALLISPYNPGGIPVIAKDADKNQIPVVVIDGGTGGADVVAFIVSDSFGGGILAGEYALKLMKEHSIVSTNIAIIKAENTATYALLRGQGFKGVMLEKGYNVVAEVTANGEQNMAYEAMKNILSSYADNLAVVFCENGLMTIGAAQAIEEAGKKGKIMIIGFDADTGVIAGIKDGLIQGTIAQQPFKMGEIGVEIANSVLQGLPVVYDDWTKKEILMEVYLIDENGKARIGII